MPLLLQIARDADEVGGIIGSNDAAVDHRIVARVLGFLPEPRTPSTRRIEPVNAFEELCREQHDPVAPADVRELVVEDDPNDRRPAPATEGRTTWGGAVPT